MVGLLQVSVGSRMEMRKRDFTALAAELRKWGFTETIFEKGAAVVGKLRVPPDECAPAGGGHEHPSLLSMMRKRDGFDLIVTASPPAPVVAGAVPGFELLPDQADVEMEVMYSTTSKAAHRMLILAFDSKLQKILDGYYCASLVPRPQASLIANGAATFHDSLMKLAAEPGLSDAIDSMELYNALTAGLEGIIATNQHRAAAEALVKGFTAQYRDRFDAELLMLRTNGLAISAMELVADEY